MCPISNGQLKGVGSGGCAEDSDLDNHYNIDNHDNHNGGDHSFPSRGKPLHGTTIDARHFEGDSATADAQHVYGDVATLGLLHR